MIIRVTGWDGPKWLNLMHVKGWEGEECGGAWIIFADDSPPLHVDETPEQIAASLFRRPQPMERQLWAA